jgi:sugar/nucleoside kinase (ribokinase family)
VTSGLDDAGRTLTYPDYLIVGHVTRDVVGNGYVPGGTVTYAGLTAQALGRRVAAVTSVGPDTSLGAVLPGFEFRAQPAAVSTTFENVYTAGHRQQWLRSVASPLTLDMIPTAWRNAPIIHLAPLAGEFGSDLVLDLEGARLLGLTPQGWMRSWDAQGRVRRSAWPEPTDALRAADAVVFSEEDVEGDWDVCRRYSREAKLLVVTRGVLGCTVFEGTHSWEVPAFPVEELDATGAGDVFAAAFFCSLLDGGDAILAARFANCVASFAVQVLGPGGIPSRRAIEERLSQGTPDVRLVGEAR